MTVRFVGVCTMRNRFGALAPLVTCSLVAVFALGASACGEVGSGNSILTDTTSDVSDTGIGGDTTAPDSDADDSGIGGDTTAPDSVSDTVADSDGGIGGDTTAPDTDGGIGGDTTAPDTTAPDADGGIGGDTTAPDADGGIGGDTTAPDADGGIGGDTTAPDVTPDVVPDVTPDVVPDVVPDVTPDVTPDVVPDVTPDVTPDTTPDVKPECVNAAGCAVPSNPCVVATCTGGKCGIANAAAGKACDDGDPCTQTDVCNAGACKGTFNGSLPECGGPSGCAAAKVVGPLPFVDAGSTTGQPNDFAVIASLCPDEDNPGGSLGNKGALSSDVVYHFTPPTTGAYTFSLAAGEGKADLVLALFSTVCPTSTGEYVCEVADDDINSGGEFISATLDGGSSYWLVIDGWSNVLAIDGAYELTIAKAPATETDCDDDNDNDGDDATDCDDTDCEFAPACEPNDVPVGALAFTEVMANPYSTGGAVDENAGEWLEVRNTTNLAVRLDQVWIAYRSWDDGGVPPAAPTAKFKLDTNYIVNAGATAVLARSNEPANNGGISFAASYGQVVISNSKAVRLQLVHPDWDGASEPLAGMIIDSVDVPALTFTQADGASWQLNSTVAGSVSAAAGNDDDSAWCFTSDAAANEYVAGNFGTPGAVNLLCGASTAASYAVDVKPILAKKCAPCHTGTTPGTCSGSACHASIYSDTQKLSQASASECSGKGYTVYQCMEARIQSGSMPFGKGCGGPVADNAPNAASCVTQSEFAVFEAWVAAGTPP
ncbi:MAG: hypothetical protein R3F39_24730 [Myxococcota bacterium]